MFRALLAISLAVGLAASMGCAELRPPPATNVEGIGLGDGGPTKSADAPGRVAAVGSNEPLGARSPLPVVVDSVGRIHGRHDDRRGVEEEALGGIGGDLLGGFVDVGVTITADTVGVGVSGAAIGTRNGVVVSAGHESPVAGDGDGDTQEERHNSLYVDVGIGGRGLSNDPASARMRVLREDAGVPTLSDRGMASNLGGEIGVIHRRISVGVRYQTSKRTCSTSAYITSSGDITSTSFRALAWDGLVDVRTWLRPRIGPLVGVAAGISNGQLEQRDLQVIKWKGTAPVYMLYAGVHFGSQHDTGWMILTRAGYAWRDFGTLDELGGDPAQRTSLDMSGPFFELSLGARVVAW